MGIINLLHAATVDSYPPPRIDDVLASMTGAKVFSKLDLSQDYLQVQLEEESKEFVTISTHKGLFQYNRLPFGVVAAPAISNERWKEFCRISYKDDILVADSRGHGNFGESPISSAAGSGKIKEGKMQIHDVQCEITGIPHLRGVNQTNTRKAAGCFECTCPL